jgi:hypothetical protein
VKAGIVHVELKAYPSQIKKKKRKRIKEVKLSRILDFGRRNQTLLIYKLLLVKSRLTF